MPMRCGAGLFGFASVEGRAVVEAVVAAEAVAPSTDARAKGA
jgi:hypothetical protein